MFSVVNGHFTVLHRFQSFDLASRSRTISEPKVVRFSMSRHAWNYQDLWELEEQRASCEFEAVRARHEFRDRRRRSRPLYP